MSKEPHWWPVVGSKVRSILRKGRILTVADRSRCPHRINPSQIYTTDNAIWHYSNFAPYYLTQLGELLIKLEID